jgi:rare lipoprotein A
MKLQFFGTFLGVLVLSACATSPHRADFKKRGVASWYGPRHHGKKTASGEFFDMNKLTAAHRTLPFNTWVRVRNMSNGNSVRVRINDRGPYSGHRIIDVSKAAAEKLGMIKAGATEVELEIEIEIDN